VRKTLFVKLIPLTATLLLAASCASSKVALPAEGCSSLAEPILGRPTEHAQLPQTGDADLDWQLYGVAETGQLNTANNDKRDGLAIIQRCEERDRKAYRKATAAWWQFWR
jgi:hypothetical protein